MRPSEALPPWLVGQLADVLLGEAPVPAGVLNLELRHVMVNRALARLYGMHQDEVIGASPVELLGHLGSQVASRCQAVAAGGQSQVGHLVTGVVASSAAEVHWQVDCMPLLSERGTGALLLLVTDVTARTRAMRRLNEQRRSLAYQASHDPVTRLANRFQLFEQLRHQHSLGRYPGLLVIDLDGFKEVNDVHGHAAGDHVLVTIAERLQGAVGGDDLVARYGGDEFVVVVEGERDLRVLADQLEAAIRLPVGWAGSTLLVGASIGCAKATPEDSVDSLLHRADEDMYRIKQARYGAR